MLPRRQFLLVLVALLSLWACINAEDVKDVGGTFSRAQRLAGDSGTSTQLPPSGSSELSPSSTVESLNNSTEVPSTTTMLPNMVAENATAEVPPATTANSATSNFFGMMGMVGVLIAALL